ncbi:ATP-grasp domain-containing protein [Agrobacterium vitis]|uniref:ATP-grasp domain-containing protein n=1 Tax=Agrobacterium vitis TaxID=373 RepID=UPI0012E86F1F|nr:transporter [Agrobacterium vitis]
MPLLNEPEVLLWNSNKRYLEEFHNLGAAIVPTIYCDCFSKEALENSLRYFEVDTVVIKPTVSATAYKTSLWRKGGEIDAPPEGGCLFQPYLSSISSYGELSLIFFDGQFSHALRKLPAKNDFRVQPEFGGSLFPYKPQESAFAAAKKIQDVISGVPLYARIDLIKDNNGEWLLIEAELIEPDLFLQFDERDGELLAKAILKRIMNS